MKNVTCEFTKLDWLIWEKIELRHKMKEAYGHNGKKYSARELEGLRLKARYLELELEIKEEIKR